MYVYDIRIIMYVCVYISIYIYISSFEGCLDVTISSGCGMVPLV